jgi:catalase
VADKKKNTHSEKPLKGGNKSTLRVFPKSLPSRNATVPKNKGLTSATGAPVANNQDVMTAGIHGPLVMEDPWLIEKLAHFDREVIPERRMHAKGWGAFGTFLVTDDITRFTKAKIFSEVGKKTKMFARFSTVAGERGAADAERDIRGFALKFYTEEGNWDLVGNDTPVFFFRDPLKFPDLNHAIKRDPMTNLRSPNTNWDFWTSLPEALLQVTLVMSDRGLPASFRFMHGFSSHAYSFINAKNERVWVKFYFRSEQGIRNWTDQQAARLVATDRESSGRDLYEAIAERMFPKWRAYIQLMSEAQAKAYPGNPFDLTKMWHKRDYPLIPVGEFVLNQNPENYFQDVEEAAFNPANVVPGISFSPDKMLQGRLFAYGDAQRYRLGVNSEQIPVNSPQGVAHPHSYHRDGAARMDGNRGGELPIEPNSFGDYAEDRSATVPPEVAGDVFRYDYRKDDHDYYRQPGELFRAMTPDQQKVLFENTARNMGDSTLQVKHRHIYHCFRADPAYGSGVAAALGIDLKTVDLQLPEADSFEGLRAANNAHPELNVPTEPVDPGHEINTSGPDYIDPDKDPYLL